MTTKSVFKWLLLGILLLGLAEGTVRVFFWFTGMDYKAFGNLENVIPDPFLGYRGKPDYELRHRTRQVTHNHYGFRGAHFSAQKPQHVFRVFCLGGSTLYGWNDEGIWPAQLQKIFRESGYPDVEVINAGLPGYTTMNSLIYLVTRIIYFDPDLIIVYQGWNDMKPWAEVSLEEIARVGYKYASHLNYPSLWDRFWSHSYLLTFIKALWHWTRAHCINKTGTLEPFIEYDESRLESEVNLEFGETLYKRNLQNIAAVCEKHRIHLILASQMRLFKPQMTLEESSRAKHFMPREYILKAFSDADRILQDVARESPVAEFVDINALVPSNLKTMQDHIHLTETEDGGGKSVAEIFFERIIPYIKKKP